MAGIRLLVADDSTTIQKVIRIALSRYDVETAVASSFMEAIGEIQRRLPDVIVVDAGLPGSSGPSDFRRLSDSAGEKPLLVLVGSYDSVDQAALESAGIRYVLRKPFESSELLQKLVELIGHELPVALGGRPSSSQASAPISSPGQPITASTGSFNLAPPPPPPPPTSGGHRPQPPSSASLSTFSTNQSKTLSEEGFSSNSGTGPNLPPPPPSMSLDDERIQAGGPAHRTAREEGLPPPPPMPPQSFSIQADEQRKGQKAFSLQQTREHSGEQSLEESNLYRTPGTSSPSPTVIPDMAMLEATLKADLERLVRETVEDYCARHFSPLAREVIAAELRRLADERARHLVDQ